MPSPAAISALTSRPVADASSTMRTSPRAPPRASRRGSPRQRCAASSATLVLPHPAGPARQTSLLAASMALNSASSLSRPTKLVADAGISCPPVSCCASSTSSGRPEKPSLRNSEETWLSTVRTEMDNRAAISRLVSRRPIAASISASRAVTPAAPRRACRAGSMVTSSQIARTNNPCRARMPGRPPGTTMMPAGASGAHTWMIVKLSFPRCRPPVSPGSPRERGEQASRSIRSTETRQQWQEKP